MSIIGKNTSIGLGQVVISTAKQKNLFSDLLPPSLLSSLTHRQIATLLTCDEFNIFAVAPRVPNSNRNWSAVGMAGAEFTDRPDPPEPVSGSAGDELMLTVGVREQVPEGSPRFPKLWCWRVSHISNSWDQVK